MNTEYVADHHELDYKTAQSLFNSMNFVRTCEQNLNTVSLLVWSHQCLHSDAYRYKKQTTKTTQWTLQQNGPVTVPMTHDSTFKNNGQFKQPSLV